MNCNKMRDLILLSATGEAGRQDAARLTAHLSTCAQCRTYRDSAGRIEEAARTCALSRQPSSDVVERIVAQARDAAARPADTLVWRPLLNRVLGLAATLVIVAGAWFYFASPADQRINEVHALVALVSDEYAAPAGAAPAQEHSKEALRRLGTKLLEWEGFAEEATLADGASPEDVTEWMLPSPTTLRSRSTAESADERCG